MSAFFLKIYSYRTAGLVPLFVLMGLSCGGCDAGANATHPGGHGESGAAPLVGWDEVTAGSGVRELAIALKDEKCLRKHGFRLQGLSKELREFPFLSHASPHIPGLYDLTPNEASTWGYSLAIPPLASEADPEYGRALSKRRQALFGTIQFGDTQRTVKILVGKLVVKVSKEGCLAEARAQIVGSMADYLKVTYLPQGIRAYITAAWSSPPVRDSLSRYLACLGATRKQLHVHYPDDMIRRVSASRPQRESHPTATELQLAGLDARCRERSGIYDAYTDAFQEAAAQWLADSRVLAERVLALSRAADVRARRVIGNYSSIDHASTG